jgi:nucleoside-diphosphate-sugar epimerase
MLEGILLPMHSNLEGPVNIGCPQYVTVKELVDTVAEVSSKNIHIKWVEGPVGVQSRNFSNAKIYSIGWRAKYFLKDGITLTYPWIEKQVKMAQKQTNSPK